MMRKTVLLATAFAFVVSMALVTGISFADNGPADLTLTTAAGKKPATFPHAKHQEINKCTDCHHIKDAEGKKAPLPEGGAVAKCESCHNADMTDPKLIDFKGAGHGLCKECHKTEAAAGKNAPTKCAGCHPKE